MVTKKDPAALCCWGRHGGRASSCSCTKWVRSKTKSLGTMSKMQASEKGEVGNKVDQVFMLINTSKGE